MNQDPSVKSTYRCGTANPRRAAATPVLGARQTRFTVIGHFADPGSAEKARSSLRTALAALLVQHDGRAGPGPLTVDAYGVEVDPLLVDGLRNVDNSLTRRAGPCSCERRETGPWMEAPSAR